MQNDFLSIQTYGQENNLLTGFSRFYDTAIEFLLIALLIFSPLVFGTVQVWSISVMHLATIIMLALWFLKMNAQGRIWGQTLAAERRLSFSIGENARKSLKW